MRRAAPDLSCRPRVRCCRSTSEDTIGLHQEYRLVLLGLVGAAGVTLDYFGSFQGWSAPVIPAVTPAVVALVMGYVADCPWLALRKKLGRPAALVVLGAQVVLPLLLATVVSGTVGRGGLVYLLGNLLVTVVNVVFSHLREHLPAS